MKKYNIRLKPIDLTKGEESNHPDFNDKDAFLCLIDNEFFAGKFSKQWYGYNFDGWSYNGCGLQYDKPGCNSSDWQAVWKIVRTKRK